MELLVFNDLARAQLGKIFQITLFGNGLLTLRFKLVAKVVKLVYQLCQVGCTVIGHGFGGLQLAFWNVKLGLDLLAFVVYLFQGVSQQLGYVLLGRTRGFFYLAL